jgi:hypothetical protein
MNKWMDSVPEHRKCQIPRAVPAHYECFPLVRWNTEHKSDLFRKQSSALHATYYYLQTFIHRPFIPSPRNPTPGVFPSLAICTNAARSCCHVLESFHKLSPLPHQPFQASLPLPHPGSSEAHDVLDYSFHGSCDPTPEHLEW